MATENEVHYLARLIGMEQAPQSWLDKKDVLDTEIQNPFYLLPNYLSAALKFYHLDVESRFVRLFEETVNVLQTHKDFQKTACLCHHILFGKSEADLRGLWNWKFDFNLPIPKMLAAVILLSGYQKHRDLMQLSALDDKQIAFQKNGIKDSCLKSITFYNREEMEASSLAWGMYYVYGRLIGVGCFNYEYGVFDEPLYVYEKSYDKTLVYVHDDDEAVRRKFENDVSFRLILKRGDDRIGVHIPTGADLRMTSILQSLAVSQKEIKKAFPIFNKKRIVYTCHSWMLSPQLPDFLSPKSHILQFKNLFTPLPCEDGPGDFLKFVFKKPKNYTNWEDLSEETSLCRNIKKHLISHKVLNCGKGVLVYRQKN